MSILLVTPPFTLLNTPYPATAYLKGFFQTKEIPNFQIDLGLEVILDLFCKKGLQLLFDSIENTKELNKNSTQIYATKEKYIQTIDAVIQFLQGKNLTIANKICTRNYLPEASRFAQVDQSIIFFGELGIIDKAKHIATLYLEDLGDFIQENIDPFFGFSRYAEKLGRSANSFDEIQQHLEQPLSIIEHTTLAILKKHIETQAPKLVVITAPFPGNLFSALRCGQFIKKNYPSIKVAFGGGFANTELRSLSEKLVFEYFDFISLDDGELPLENIWLYIHNQLPIENLKRTYVLLHNEVIFINNSNCTDYKQHEIGTPNYTDLHLDQYINVIEVSNPMHKLWSDGRWNKLTMAHGCYWAKCTFCDVSLPYIKDYEPIAAKLLCDRIETIIAQTGTTGFHFVDEAAPPSLMIKLAIEILNRNINISWWTNIRFEKSFTQDVCYLLAASGCIAVSGGLEIASERLLLLINKGITVPQVTKVTAHFRAAGIMTHAYLMYGYPTQTVQETIDSLEMVRQLFALGLVQSGYWHRFALTAHSPIGINPKQYKIEPHFAKISFANNDIAFTDASNINHDEFSFGLEKSLLNYMHQSHFDQPLQHWFTQKIPKPSLDKNIIEQYLTEKIYEPIKLTAKVIFIGNKPNISFSVQSKKGMQRTMAEIAFSNNRKKTTIVIPELQGKWLIALLEKIHYSNQKIYTYKEIAQDYENAELIDFELFWENKPINKLNEFGLLVL
jgi:hypothetical protein